MILFNKHFVYQQFSVASNRVLKKGWQSIAVIFCLAFSLSLSMSSLKITRGITAEDINISKPKETFSINLTTSNSEKVNYKYIKEFARQQNFFKHLSFFTFGQGEVKFYNQSSEQYTVGIAEPSLWTTLDLFPYIGQWPKSPHEIVISYQFWENKFSSDTDIIGRSIEINNVPYIICAVLEQSFITPPYKMIQALETVNGKTALWLPLNELNSPGINEYLGIGQSKSPQQELQHAVNQTFNIKEDDKYPINITIMPFLDKVNESTLWLRVFYISITSIFSIVVITALFNILLSNTMSYRANTALRMMLGGSLLQVYIIDFFELLILFFIAILIAMPFNFLLQSFINNYSLYSFGSVSAVPEFTVFFIIVSISLLVLSTLAFLPHLMIPQDTLINEQGSGSKGSTNTRSGLQHIFFNMQLSISLILICFSVFFISNKSQQVDNFFTNRITDVVAIELQHKNSNLESLEITQLYQEVLKHAQYLGYNAALSTSSPLDLAGNSVVLKSAQTNDLSFHTVSVSKQYFNIMGNRFLEGQGFPELQPFNNDIVVSEFLFKFLQSDSPQALANFKSHGYDHILGVVSESRIANRVYSNFIRHQDGIVYSLYNGYSETSSADRMHLILAQGEISMDDYNHLFLPFIQKINIKPAFSLEKEQKNRMKSVFIGLIFSAVLLLSGLTITVISCWSMVQFSCKLRRAEFGLKLALGAPPISIIVQYMKDMVISVLWSLTFTLIIICIGISFFKMLPGYSSFPIGWIILICFIFILAVLASSMIPLYKYIYKNNPMSSLREN